MQSSDSERFGCRKKRKAIGVGGTGAIGDMQRENKERWRVRKVRRKRGEEESEGEVRL